MVLTFAGMRAMTVRPGPAFLDRRDFRFLLLPKTRELPPKAITPVRKNCFLRCYNPLHSYQDLVIEEGVHDGVAGQGSQ